MSRADELRRQIRERMAEYQALLAAGTEGEHAVVRLREVRRLEAELDRIESGTDKRE